MFVGNDGGIFKTSDARAATVRSTAGVCDPFVGAFDWEHLNNGYGVTQFYHGLPYPDGAAWFGGTQDNGTVRGNDAAGPNGWTAIFGGDGGFVAVDPTDTDVLYVSTPGLALRKSTDGGQTFSLKTDGITESSGNFLFVTPYVMDPSNPDRLWIGGSQLWRTDNAAESWSAASRVVASDDFPIVSAIAVAPSDSNRVLAGTVEGFIHRNNAALSATGTTRWQRNRPRQGWVSWLAHDPVNPSIAYATFSTFGGGAHVWKSVDGGATGRRSTARAPARCPTSRSTRSRSILRTRRTCSSARTSASSPRSTAARPGWWRTRASRTRRSSRSPCRTARAARAPCLRSPTGGGVWKVALP